jgi:hypothetical protein
MVENYEYPSSHIPVSASSHISTKASHQQCQHIPSY